MGSIQQWGSIWDTYGLYYYICERFHIIIMDYIIMDYYIWERFHTAVKLTTSLNNQNPWKGEISVYVKHLEMIHSLKLSYILEIKRFSYV